MAAAAEPQPASLPLPGGRENAVVRVHPVTTGTAMYPEDAFFRRGGRLAGLHSLGFRSKRIEIPIPAYVVEHPGAGLILIDTGFHASVAVDRRANLGPVLGRVFNPKMGTDEGMPDQLRARGFSPADVATVVMTHLHVDHASGVAQFPDATFVVSEREWRAASKEKGLRGGYVRRQFDHAFDWRTLDFDADEVNSYVSFGRTLDLFGDGSVRLAYTPGHTLGHMSVVLRTGGGELLVAADAAYTMRTIKESVMPYGAHDEHEFRRSLRELQRYIEQKPDAVVSVGHDLEAFRALEPVY
ncbi:MAG TPA: N-acyl homoserine lactonase family protein [Thermoleophilaceae bacterium]|nr:N-acyl homoserine lactonase family protein [Thermoleophilaceae bacterium]